jgi:uncharacterized membrane protein
MQSTSGIRSQFAVDDTSMQAATPINMSITERQISAMGAAALGLIAGRQRSLISIPLAAASLMLLYQAVTGHSPLNDALDRNSAVLSERHAVSVPHQQGIHVVESITILRPRADLYAYWRSFENFASLFSNLKSVQVMPGNRSHWTANGPAGTSLEWDAEIINEVPNEVIAWRSLEGAVVPNAGSVRFRDAPADRGTEVTVTLEYSPPGGQLARAAAALFGKEPHVQVAGDLRRFKALMEIGEIPTNTGPHGRRSPFG